MKPSVLWYNERDTEEEMWRSRAGTLEVSQSRRRREKVGLCNDIMLMLAVRESRLLCSFDLRLTFYTNPRTFDVKTG